MSSSASRTRARVAGERTRARSSHTRTGEASPSRAPRRATPERTPPVAARRAWRRFVAPVAALAVAVGLLGAAGAAALQDPAGEAARTRAATSAARTSIEQMLSYNHKTIDAQAAQIETLLTGDFKKEFATAMDQDIKPLAVKNRTVVQARVSDIAVMDASEDQVTVLAFVNQAKVGADEKQAAIDQNRVIATLASVGGRWLISDVKAF